MASASEKEINGLRRSAILLQAFDDDTTAEILRNLSSDEIRTISQEMAVNNRVFNGEMEAVMDSFYTIADEYSILGGGSTDQMHSILTKVLGNDRAQSIIDDITEAKATNSGIDTLNLIDAATVSEMIKDEHPQIIATILVHLERTQAADILQAFDEKIRSDLLLRIATFNGVQPAALQALTEVLSGMVRGQNLKRSKMGGIKTAAEILNMMSSAAEEAVMESIRAYDEDLVQKIVDEMFLFENLESLDDTAIKLILKEVESASLGLALKGAPESLQNKFMGNMSTRAADMLRDDMEARGPVRLSVVEEEQKNVLQVVRRMAESGEIMLSSADEDYV